VVGSSATSTRHRDQRTLTHTAGELVRVRAVLGVRVDAHLLQRGRRPLAGLLVARAEVQPVHGGDLLADAVVGIEAGQRLLKDHGQLAATDLAQGRVVRGVDVDRLRGLLARLQQNPAAHLRRRAAVQTE
jgi:hypothetical protein